MIVMNNESPMVVVLSGSMEPSMFRGDILVLLRKPKIEIGDVIVYQIKSEKIPIVHRISAI
jgi:signal peptidase